MEKETTNEKETKRCPYCGEEILAVAQKCKHCGEWLVDQEQEASAVPSIESDDDNDTDEYVPTGEVSKSVNIGIWVFTIIVVLLAIGALHQYADSFSRHDYQKYRKFFLLGYVLIVAGTPRYVKILKNIYNLIFNK